MGRQFAFCWDFFGSFVWSKGAIMPAKLVLLLLFGALSFSITGAGAQESQTSSQEETLACEIVRKRGDWYEAARQSESRWGVPAAHLLALLTDDQKLSSGQLPARWRPLWSTGISHPGLPDGFFESTWAQYQHQIGQPKASSSSVPTILDFMGWYISSLAQHHNLATDDAAGQFVLWRFGRDMYASGKWGHAPWVKMQADQFAARTLAYKADLNRCTGDLDDNRSDKLSADPFQRSMKGKQVEGRSGFGKPGYVPNEFISSK